MIKKLFLSICILIINTTLFAQSGRIIPPTPTPTPTPEASSTPETKKEHPPCEVNLEEYIYIPPKNIVDFTNELNRYGECGYRLEKSNKIPLEPYTSEMDTDFFAVMKLDRPHKYEYEVFEAYAPGQTQTRMNYRSKEGFYFKASHPFQIIAENADGDFVDSVTNKWRSVYGTFLIFEKIDGKIIQREYRIIDADGVGEKVKEANQAKLNSYLGQGFHPVGFVKANIYYGIIMEKGEQEATNSEYKFLHYNFSLAKKLGELSQTGFEPDLLIPYAALLKKEANPATSPKSFILIENPDKLLDNSNILKDKYYLRSSLFYVDSRDLKPSLLFVEDGKTKNKYEYKFSPMTNVAKRPKGENKENTIRKPPTAEMLEEFQKLLKQGYIIREILASKEIYVLFERQKP